MMERMASPDESNLPLNKRVPPTSVASPSQLRPLDPKDVRWYLPSWGETMKLFGWRWIYFLPAAGLLLAAVISPWLLLAQIFIIWLKLIVAAVVIPAVAFIATAKDIIRKRTDPFCIHCGYRLEGLPDNYVCPECGEPYSFQVIDEYRRDPHWFISRYKQRGDHPATHAPFEAGKFASKRSKDGT